MPARPTAALLALALAVPAGLAAGPAAAGSLLAAPPVHARPGACYAHVRQAARYAPPPGPRSSWRLSPPPPGAPGPVWCLVSEPAGPPVQLQAERDGWVRVACATGRPAHRRVVVHHRVVRHTVVHHVRMHVLRPAPHVVHIRYAPPCCVAPPPPPCCHAVVASCCIRGPLPPAPPPVMIIPAYNPAVRYGLPGPHVLHWAGKTG